MDGMSARRAELDEWAGWTDAQGAGHCRPLFEGEPRGHGYTGPLEPGEVLLQVARGEYPDKDALCTEAYRAVQREAAEQCAADSPEGMARRIAALEAENGELWVAIEALQDKLGIKRREA